MENQNQLQPTWKRQMFMWHEEGLNLQYKEEVHYAPSSPMLDSSIYLSTYASTPCMDHIALIKPQKVRRIETSITDYEIGMDLASLGLRTQDLGIAFYDHMTNIRPTEAFHQV
jgi:hypothetical protein